MDLKRQGLLIITKMALQDGAVSLEERQTLADMGGGLTESDVEELIDEARSSPIDVLLSGIDTYEDRFVIALRAYHMAHSDAHLDIVEEMNFELLADRFEITPEDRALIERIQWNVSGDGPVSLEPRLLELHRGSSFSQDLP